MTEKNEKEFTELFRKISSVIVGTEHKNIKLCEIDPKLTIDIRSDRKTNKESIEVGDSVRRKFLKEVSPFILMVPKEKMENTPLLME